MSIVTLGPSLYTAIAAADMLQSAVAQGSRPRLWTAAPLNYAPVAASVRKTARCYQSPTRSSAAGA